MQRLIVAKTTHDPLPSWNDVKSRQNVISFVNQVTTRRKDFVPVSERIATFDNTEPYGQNSPCTSSYFLFLKE